MTQVKFNRRPFDGSFNNLISELFSEFPVSYKNNGNEGQKGFAPVNIIESENQYQLEVVAPGFDKSDFKVNVDQDVLTISAEQKTEAADSNKKQVRKEFSFRSFKRTFTLDEKIDGSEIAAKYVNGVLSLNLPKKAEVKSPAKEISIQ